MDSVRRKVQWRERPIARFLLAILLCFAFASVASDGTLAASKRKRSAPSTSIAAAIVVDMNSGSVLHAEAADTPRYPASLTKMMTLYVLFGYMKAGKISPSSEFVITAHAASQSPTKLGLKAGSKIAVTDAIKSLVTLSANDIAVAVAENISGSEENFAKLMTETARRIGMKNTTFRNASGLPNDEQISTARDMAILSVRLIQDYPEYYGVFETRTFSYKGRSYRNHNRLLFGYAGTDGIKTGYTRASGFNLAASVKRDGKHLVAVVLGGRTGAGRDLAMRALLDKHFPKASTGKTPAKSLIASLLGSSTTSSAAPFPPVQKPTALAETAPAPFAPAPSPAEKPGFALAAATPGITTAVETSEGDLGDPSDAQTKRTRGANLRFEGDFHVQVGAFMSQSEAEYRLGVVQQRAPDLLEGHLPFTATFMKKDKEWFRARFAGFSKDDARATCEALKKRSFECAVMPAE